MTSSPSYCPAASKALPSIREEEGAEVAQRSKTPTGKEKLAEDYPGLEPAFSPLEPLFKFKGQALMHEDSSAGTIRAAPGMAEVAVYNMAQEGTFRPTPLGAAVSISPRSRLGRTQSSLGPGEADRVLRGENPEQLLRSQSQASFGYANGRTFSSIDRTRSSFNYADPATQSLMERTGSFIAQYDAQVSHEQCTSCLIHDHYIERSLPHGYTSSLGHSNGQCDLPCSSWGFIDDVYGILSLSLFTASCLFSWQLAKEVTGLFDMLTQG